MTHCDGKCRQLRFTGVRVEPIAREKAGMNEKIGDDQHYMASAQGRNDLESASGRIGELQSLP